MYLQYDVLDLQIWHYLVDFMVKYYITFLRFTIVSIVIGILEIETMLGGGGGGFHESWIHVENINVLILQRIPHQG